jgi:hypothetical protein
MIHVKTSEMLVHNPSFCIIYKFINKNARVLASMNSISGSVCVPSVNVIGYMQVLLHFYYSRNKLHFYSFGTGGKTKNLCY